MNIQKKKLSELKAASYNPRTISDEALAGLRASIEKFGLVQPIVANRQTDFTVISGHQRLKILQEQGVQDTQVVVVDLPLAEEKALNIVQNNPAITGEYNLDLPDLLEEIKLDIPEYEGLCLPKLEMPKESIPEENEQIDEDAMKDTEHECPKCGFEW